MKETATGSSVRAGVDVPECIAPKHSECASAAVPSRIRETRPRRGAGSARLRLATSAAIR
jgi:hypothetical protein